MSAKWKRGGGAKKESRKEVSLLLRRNQVGLALVPLGSQNFLLYLPLSPLLLGNIRRRFAEKKETEMGSHCFFFKSWVSSTCFQGRFLLLHFSIWQQYETTTARSGGKEKQIGPFCYLLGNEFQSFILLLFWRADIKLKDEIRRKALTQCSW